MSEPHDLTAMMDRHARFMKMALFVLPSSLMGLDLQRMTLVYFSVSGLDVLNRLNLIEDMRDDIINWIYSNLINCDIDDKNRCGFRGSCTLRAGGSDEVRATHSHDYSHIAMTYTALSTLVILGDDLSRLNREGIAKAVRSLQLPNGSFKAASEGGEDDMRFIYCAAAISKLINVKSAIDKELATQYIIKSISYEGGIGQGPDLEAHGGSTYCAVATLSLMENLDALSMKQRSDLVRWLVNRQHQGFNGRPDKDDDTCYTFWIGATLNILNASDLVKWDSIFSFVLTTEDPLKGGFGKWPDSNSDLLHTYLGWSGLSLGDCQELSSLNPGLQIIDPELNITQRAKKLLLNLHTTTLLPL